MARRRRRKKIKAKCEVDHRKIGFKPCILCGYVKKKKPTVKTCLQAGLHRLFKFDQACQFCSYVRKHNIKRNERAITLAPAKVREEPPVRVLNKRLEQLNEEERADIARGELHLKPEVPDPHFSASRAPLRVIEHNGHDTHTANGVTTVKGYESLGDGGYRNARKYTPYE